MNAILIKFHIISIIFFTMIAIATPGKCPVFCFICSVTSCKSNKVRPQLGQDTKSVFTDLILDPKKIKNNKQKMENK